MSKSTALLLAIVISLPVKGAENSLAWPRFRGPDGSGIATDGKPPIDIGPDKNVKWKVSVPGGLSSPIIAGDKLYCIAADGEIVAIAADKEFKLLGRSALGESSSATPIVHRGNLILRGESSLASLPATGKQ